MNMSQTNNPNNFIKNKDLEDTILRDVQGLAGINRDVYGDSTFQIQTTHPAHFMLVDTPRANRRAYQLVFAGLAVVGTVVMVAALLLGVTLGQDSQTAQAQSPEVLGISESLYQD